jgi:hypothetical protein
MKTSGKMAHESRNTYEHRVAENRYPGNDENGYEKLK